MQKPLMLAAALSLLSAPVLAQNIPAEFQGKWVGFYQSANPSEAQLRQYCKRPDKYADQEVFFLRVKSHGFEIFELDSNVKSVGIRIARANGIELEGQASIRTALEDDTMERKNNQQWSWAIDKNDHLVDFSEWYENNPMVFFRCPR